jgi:hypothetical protein
MSKSRHEFDKSLPYDEKKGCKDGYHKRSSYLSYLGFRVPPRCVRSTTVYKNSSQNFKKKDTNKTRRAQIYIPSIKSLSRKACPPGMIERKAFSRKYSTAVREKGFTVRRTSGTVYHVRPKKIRSNVAPTCIKDLGRPGRGPKKIGPLRKGELAKFGYSYKYGENERHKALRQAVDEFGALGVYRKLDAVAKLSESNPGAHKASEVFTTDRNWVKSRFGPLKAFADSKK